jgi:hypothetical protein
MSARCGGGVIVQTMMITKHTAQISSFFLLMFSAPFSRVA